jgi:hypothetical protein
MPDSIAALLSDYNNDGAPAPKVAAKPTAPTPTAMPVPTPDPSTLVATAAPAKAAAPAAPKRGLYAGRAVEPEKKRCLGCGTPTLPGKRCSGCGAVMRGD